MGEISIADKSLPVSTEPTQFQLADESAFQSHVLGKPNGVTIKALPNGCIYSIEHGNILINQILASPLAGGIQRIYLRILRQRHNFIHGNRGAWREERVLRSRRIDFSGPDPVAV